MATVGGVVLRSADVLRKAGIDSAATDARLLAGAALNLDRAGLLAERDRALTAADVAAVEVLVRRRLAREPVSRILGRREFWSLDLRITAAVLDPRPDSETLVATVLDLVDDRQAPWLVLDLGTGSGCLLLALLTELPRARGIGVDLCPAALACARANARRLGLGDRACFVAADWAGSLACEAFHIVVTNPPYIATGGLDSLPPEVARYDPPRALDGGADGLAVYRRLVPQIAGLLRPDGIAAVEVGAGQAAEVAGLLSRHRLSVVDVRRDLAGIERCVAAQNRVGIPAENG
ncbi:MAG: peptide chain release factor N(5)-glutamine methyltransferase [Rhodospirillaceae bacterium]|nr:peptide chain release factor N(5)-glutamine methyltransferase [Rhodospirillaceae bacterium]